MGIRLFFCSANRPRRQCPAAKIRAPLGASRRSSFPPFSVARCLPVVAASHLMAQGPTGNEMQIARGHFSRARGSEFLITPRPVPAAPGCRIPLSWPRARARAPSEKGRCEIVRTRCVTKRPGRYYYNALTCRRGWQKEIVSDRTFRCLRGRNAAALLNSFAESVHSSRPPEC